MDPATEALSHAEHRPDAVGKVTGRARYTTDHRPAGTLHVRYVTSPIPHGSVARISTDAALAVPGVVAVVTGRDATPVRMGRRLQDWPLLAWDRVRFIGERVAAVAAESEDAAEEGAMAVEVEYDQLPAVLDAEAALAPDAPVLHPDAAEYRYLGGLRPPVSHPNIQGEILLRKGAQDDRAFEALFQSAARVFEHRFTTRRQHQGALEPHAAIVEVGSDGRTHIRTTNKSPFLLRGQMAAALGLDPQAIELVSGAIGGDFGGKGLSIDEYACYLLARATGRPVRAVATSDEELTSYAPRHGSTITLRSVVDDQGRIQALDADLLYDGGAYAAGKPIPELIPPGAVDVLSPYDVPHMRLRVRSVYTNTLPGGHMRCPGELQAVFAGESHVDLIAAGIGRDPLEFRRINLAGPSTVTIAGERMREPTGTRVLELLERELPARDGPDEGIGVALIARKMEGGRTSIAAGVAADGAVELTTALPDQGAGAHTAIARICAAALGIPPERVRVIHTSTAGAPVDLGVGASRVTFLAGGATLDAVEQIRVALEEAASVMEPAAGRFVLVEGRFISEDGRTTRSWDEVAGRPSLRDLAVVGSFDTSKGEHGVADFSFAAIGVCVRIDRETGVWQVRDAVLVADTGTIVNPVAHAGQMDGGFAQGLGAAMMEELVLVDGQVTTANLGDYRLPAATDVPVLRRVFISDVPGPGAFGAKMAGELSPAGVAPAVANAIDRAVGARVTTIPITPERLLAAMGAQRSRSRTLPVVIPGHGVDE